MRLKLTLTPNEPASMIPLNYPYLVSSFIYKTIGKVNSPFAEWLHEQGFKNGVKQYRLFSFALRVPKFKIYQDRMIILSPTIELTLSFYLDKAVSTFVTGLFTDQICEIVDRKSRTIFKVSYVNVEEKPTFKETMRYRCITPLCITHKGQAQRYATYLSPDHELFESLFLNNLASKYQAAQQHQDQEILAPLLRDSRVTFDFLKFHRTPSRLVTMKAFSKEETKIRGFLFDFEMTAPPVLQEFAYFGGFGEKTSGAGFGFAKII